MAKDGGMNIVLLGGLAVGGYLLYQYMTAGSLPADAVFVAQMAPGAAWAVPQSFASTGTPAAGTPTAQAYVYHSPSTGLIYLSYTAPTPAQLAALQTGSQPPLMGGAPATSTVQTSSGPVTSPTTPSGGAIPSGPLTSGSQSLDSVYTHLKTLAGSDPNFTGSGDSLSSSPDHWNVYVNQLLPGASLNLDTLFGGPNRFSPVTAAIFWAKAGPVLGKQFGLSGLGLYAGLGAYLTDSGVFPLGWA